MLSNIEEELDKTKAGARKTRFLSHKHNKGPFLRSDRTRFSSETTIYLIAFRALSREPLPVAFQNSSPMLVSTLTCWPSL